MGDIERKVYAIEQIDKHIVGPAYTFLRKNQDALGGIIIAPDHYTNHFPRKDDPHRFETHSADLVPFALWNGTERDFSQCFSEEDVLLGKYGNNFILHTRLLQLFRWS